MSIELPEVSGRLCSYSNEEMEGRLCHQIGEEQAVILPDNALIDVLCEAVRMAREYSDSQDKHHEKQTTTRQGNR